MRGRSLRRRLTGAFAVLAAACTLVTGITLSRFVEQAMWNRLDAGLEEEAELLVDMAADAGGNVEGTVAGESVVKHGVTVVGASNLARSLAADASGLFARNLFNFLSAFWDKEQNRPVLPDDDEIVNGIRLTQGGKVVNERLTGAAS